MVMDVINNLTGLLKTSEYILTNMCSSKGNALLYINRIGHYFEISTSIVVVQTHTQHCKLLFNSLEVTNKTQIDRVQKLQNFAAKVAYDGLRKYDPVYPVFKELE